MEPQRFCEKCRISKYDYEMAKGRTWCKPCTNERNRSYQSPPPPPPQVQSPVQDLMIQQLIGLTNKTFNIETKVDNVQNLSERTSITVEAALEAGAKLESKLNRVEQEVQELRAFSRDVITYLNQQKQLK